MPRWLPLLVLTAPRTAQADAHDETEHRLKTAGIDEARPTRHLSSVMHLGPRRMTSPP
jgi:hypothetical protein